MSNFTIEFVAEDGTILYTDGKRTVRVRCNWSTQWQFESQSLNWWQGPNGREPVNARDQEKIQDRVLQAAGKKGLGPYADPARRSAGSPAGPDEPNDELSALFGQIYPPIADAELLAKINQALAYLKPSAEQNWDVALSISRQLEWCRNKITGQPVETPPGPFSMGLMATREFDMYGSNPEIAAVINEVQHEMERRGFP